jgi:hypothetical protein
LSYFFYLEDGGDIPPKRRFIINPDGVTSQKMAFFTVTAVKTSNPTLTNQLLKLKNISEEVRHRLYKHSKKEH